ncbi:hypothetical protein M011DRAFT_479263 [Sporormia fimetaria CBS 119925]|uniref:Extracellular membrane protein CFEM domain-containing protein n=1 Tax=Sporormia fimetaria CBS 119925 TaxID=1340428 RepID=A0A6A6V3G2_9PLEO|nr:hypothetical protein M011DRAFT_479263 [Sporormia fimetaria CBS 119925]
MPSLTTILTTTLTLTSLAPSITAQTPSPIIGLRECNQRVLIDRLAGANCNIANIGCICDQVRALRIGKAIRAVCTADEVREYDAFIASRCPPIRQQDTTRNLTSTTVVPVIPISTGTGPSNFTSSLGPFVNTTTQVVMPTMVTTDVLVPTTGSNGEPTTVVQETVLPVVPTGPSFEGAGVKGVEMPEWFSGRSAFVVGAMGIMGLVFAEL